MPKYEYDDTIAIGDCAYRAYGETLEDLFANAALAATACMVDLETVDTTLEHRIEIEAENSSDLLYNWLEEIVFLKDARDLFLTDFSIEIFDNNRKLKATGRGEKINRDKHGINGDIKAVTMYRFSLKKCAGGWEAFIVLDL